MRNAKENSSLLPSKMSATEFTLQAKPRVCLENGFIEIHLSWRQISYPYGPVQ